MAAVQLITENINLWTSAIKAKPTQGRGSSKKLELYGIKKLRELILELAVRGKLVPQDPNDEAASVLLEQIAAEKAQWRKENCTKKPKKLADISDDEKPYELPSGWAWARFGEIFDLEYGDNLPEAKRSNTGEYPVYGSNGVVGSHEKCSVNKSCIVIGRKGSAGALNLCLSEGCWVTDVAYSLVPPSGLNLNFTFKLLHTLGLDNLGKGIKPGLSRNEADILLLSVPPIAEQHRIDAKVEELMALCDLLEQKTEASFDAHEILVKTLLESLTNAKDVIDLSENWERLSENFDTLITTDYALEQLKQTILQLAVIGKLVPQDPTDEPASELLARIAAEKEQLIKEKKIARQVAPPQISEEEKTFKLPEGWAWSRVWNIAMTITSGSRDWAKYYSDTGATFVTMGNLSRGSYALRMDNVRYVSPPDNGEGQRTRLLENDLLISITGDVGNLGLIPNNFGEAYINQHTALLRLLPECQGRFIPEVMRSPWAKYQFDAPQRGIKNSFRLGDIGDMLLAIPPLAEQTRIVTKVDQLMALCDRLQARLNEAKITKLHLADAVTYKVIGEPTNHIEDAELNAKTMKITTMLSLAHEEFDQNAIIAPIILELGGSADAKDVWIKTKLNLPEFYAQLKLEVDSQYIRRPTNAEFIEA